jgi:transposase InsO family protein
MKSLFSTDLARIRQQFKEGALLPKPALVLLEDGLQEDNIRDVPEGARPDVINDWGCLMKGKPIQRLCEEHSVPRLFAQPKTPYHNPFIESAFSTLKRAREYLGRFLDVEKATEYLQRYFA